MVPFQINVYDIHHFHEYYQQYYNPEETFDDMLDHYMIIMNQITMSFLLKQPFSVVVNVL